MRFRDRDAWIVAVFSVVMWLGICWVLGGFGRPGPIAWIVAVLLFVGGVVTFGGPSVEGEAAAEAEDDASRKRKRRRKPAKKSIYGPPD